MTKSEKSILLGLALGDGHLKVVKSKKMNTACLMLEHSSKQEDYLHFKREILERVLQTTIPPIYKFKRKDLGNEKVTLCKTHRYFGILRKVLYPFGKKTYTPMIMRRMTDEAVALWWADDSSIRKRVRNPRGYIRSWEAWLWTYCSIQETVCLIDFFEKQYGVTPGIAKRKSKIESGKFYYSLRFGTKALRAIIPRIRPFACESMLYKFPDLQTGLIDS